MVRPAVRSLILKRFRSIPSERIEFDNPTFLVGRNGSGKSNLVDAFSFLADSMAVPLQAGEYTVVLTGPPPRNERRQVQVKVPPNATQLAPMETFDEIRVEDYFRSGGEPRPN